MFECVKYNFPERRQVVVCKTLCGALTEGFLDSWAQYVHIYSLSNMAGFRENALICELDPLNLILITKYGFRNSDLSGTLKFISNMYKLNCKINFVHRDFLDNYVKEVSNK